jgi:hypothetical protein
MTLLLPKANRDNCGIDTYERGFIYAALLLRASNTSENNTIPGNKNPYFNNVRIATSIQATASGISSLIVVQARLLAVREAGLKAGADFIKNILPFDNINPNPLTVVASPSISNNLLIDDEPVWVNSLEKYLAWCAVNLIAGYLDLNDQQLPPISAVFTDENTETVIYQIDARLPFNYFVYLAEGNLLAAISSVVQSGLESDEMSSLVAGVF